MYRPFYRFRSSLDGLSTLNHYFLSSGGQSNVIDGPRLPVQIFSIVSYPAGWPFCDISIRVRSFHTDCNWSPLCSRPQQETAKLAQSSILRSTIRPVYLKLFLSFAFSQCSSHNMVSSTENTVIYWWDTNTVPVVCPCC